MNQSAVVRPTESPLTRLPYAEDYESFGISCDFDLESATSSSGRVRACEERAAVELSTATSVWDNPSLARDRESPRGNEVAIRLLDRWMTDESSDDAVVWPKVKRVLEENRLSNRSLFRRD